MSQGWKEIAELFVSQAVLRRREWGCDFPPKDCLPSPVLEDEVTLWCVVLSLDLRASLNAPEMVRPWILARLVTCAMDATVRATEQAGEEPVVSRDFVGRMLVDEWYARLRQDWNLLILTDAAVAGNLD
jgi:hypothetical protein